MKPAYGYVFEKNGVKVGFTGDTTLCKSVEYMAKTCSYLIIDCMFKEATSKHMGVDKLQFLLEKYPNCEYVVTHLEDETRDYLKELRLKNVIVPEDNDTIIIGE